MSDPFFYRLMILGKPVCGCLEFENPILKIEFRTQVTYVFPACHDMEGVWSEEFLSATCSLNNIVPYDIIVEKIYVTNGDFKFEQVNYQPDWRMLVERYTYRDEGSGVVTYTFPLTDKATFTYQFVWGDNGKSTK